jgi:DNA-binding HxlR family transcriptional regulator
LEDDADLVAFVREHVRSVWALELLLTLRRDSSRLWTSAELVKELRASPGLVAENLQRLARAALVVREDGDSWRYAPAGAALDALCGRLEAAYRERPVALINVIARPSDPLQSLADAFKFRGEDRGSEK